MYLYWIKMDCVACLIRSIDHVRLLSIFSVALEEMLSDRVPCFLYFIKFV
jgi:hypothetical protein